MLDEAVNSAIPHVDDYGENCCIGLEAPMTAWAESEAQEGRGPLVTTGGNPRSATSGSFGNVVSGYGPIWGVAPKACGTIPRSASYDWYNWLWGMKAIPPGFQLVPVENSQRTDEASSKFQTDHRAQDATRIKSTGGDQNVGIAAKTMKVEGWDGGRGTAAEIPTTDPSYATRKGRLQRHEQYFRRRAQQTTYGPRAGGGGYCFWCGRTGHFIRECNVKKADLAATSGEDAQNARPDNDAGNAAKVLSLAGTDSGKQRRNGSKGRRSSGALSEARRRRQRRKGSTRRVSQDVLSPGDGGTRAVQWTTSDGVDEPQRMEVLQSRDGATRSALVKEEAGEYGPAVNNDVDGNGSKRGGGTSGGVTRELRWSIMRRGTPPGRGQSEKHRGDSICGGSLNQITAAE
ncbi:LOW QUALITY PROTEIN: hypothetical protein PHMEG_00014280 [Phytophthora megakarya]|uniref:CCHC-type domain-containing protein n=1 Tax=Phytophthora megakarya TaxID=4795 RepID=A0A225W471_9STRA|nr:LOW QUALITY PROTEIN: hypothetical protein PHMEG_00014280 [Phytophthora megakarya]